MNDYRPGAHSRCLADGPINPRTGGRPWCDRPINHPGDHRSPAGTMWHPERPRSSADACPQCGSTLPHVPAATSQTCWRNIAAAIPPHDCEPNDAGTACRHCGAPAEPVSPDELAAAFPPDALALCNACDINAADPDSAAGYCRDCAASAVR